MSNLKCKNTRVFFIRFSHLDFTYSIEYVKMKPIRICLLAHASLANHLRYAHARLCRVVLAQ